MNTFTKSSRRDVLSLGAAASALAAIPFASAQQAGTKPIKPEPVRGARQDLDLVRSFVGAGHKDANLAQVKEMLDREPKLVYASHD